MRCHDDNIFSSPSFMRPSSWMVIFNFATLGVIKYGLGAYHTPPPPQVCVFIIENLSEEMQLMSKLNARVGPAVFPQAIKGAKSHGLQLVTK